MKVRISRKSGAPYPIFTAYFVKDAGDYRKYPILQKTYFSVGEVVDLPEENINIALQRFPDLQIEVITEDSVETIRVQENQEKPRRRGRPRKESFEIEEQEQLNNEEKLES